VPEPHPEFIPNVIKSDDLPIDHDLPVLAPPWVHPKVASAATLRLAPLRRAVRFLGCGSQLLVELGTVLDSHLA
jgi:hypothetical protein